MHTDFFFRSARLMPRLTAPVLIALSALLGGCSSTGEQPPAYDNAYQPYRSICVVTEGEHSPVLDVALMRTLRDRGFEPEFIKRGQPERARRCRGIVTFASGAVNVPLDSPSEMSLGFVDSYTGESYHVSVTRRHSGESKSLFFGRPLPDPAVTIRHLVDRLFPERPESN